MKAKDKNQPELWRDTLDEGVPADFAQESLARMLGSARRRRQRKLAVKAGLGSALLVPLLVLILDRAPQGGTGTKTGAPPIAEADPVTEPPLPPVVPPPPGAPKAMVVETINDEELLAAFGNRSVILVGTGNSKQLMLLDKKKPR